MLIFVTVIKIREVCIKTHTIKTHTKPGKRSLKLRKLIRNFEAIDECFNCLKIEIY